jgi:hypothetical protein
VERIRIVTAELPRLRGEIVADILGGQEDMELVRGFVRFGPRLLRALNRLHVDVVVIGRSDPATAAAMLARRPGIAVIGLSEQGRITIFEVVPRATARGLSPQALAEVIRQTARSRQDRPPPPNN